MPNQKGAKRGLESSKSKIAPEDANEKSAMPSNVLIDSFHDYAATAVALTLTEEDMDEFPPLPVTPLKSPAPKKVMYERSSSDPDDANQIISRLSALINTRSDDIESMVRENTLQTDGLKKTIEFVSVEMKDMKGKVCDLEKKVTKEEGRVDNCQQRISELERYSRRWNLRLHGVKEAEKEDVREKVIEICKSVLPKQNHRLPDVIDTVHRLGAKRQGSTRPRGIIVQFTSRIYRDAVWKAAKTSSYLQNNHLRFAEDLSREDKERRDKLWPMIDKARKEGKPAYFVGG
uniref:L1 transposable element RRM domain-containing protein n=1 Tax=Nothobranchius kuhntae TaxID=321403 RepID=A0A1A8JAE1_NOTKU